MKKLLGMLAVTVLLLAALPFGVSAQEEEQLSLVELVMQEAHDSYYQSRKTAGKLSFHGTCGLMVSHQLYNLGINKRCIVFDGNDHYDYYSEQKVTTGGYYINPYTTMEYNLLDSLKALTDNGKRDVRNVMVCFQWTNTEKGAIYGHVMLINGIVGGKVYFVESFPCPLGGDEGTVICCTMEEFAQYYDKWTVFEGLIHFGMGTYHDVCPNTATDITVQTRFPTILRSEPAVVGWQGCVRLRSIAAGERLHATGIYYDGRSKYYRVQTQTGFGFVAAGAVSFLQINDDTASLSGLRLSPRIEPGTQPIFGGAVTDESGQINSAEVCVTDYTGKLVRRKLLDTENTDGQLAQLRDVLLFELLELGPYRIDFFAGRACPVVEGGEIVDYYKRVFLGSRSLFVGSNPRDAMVKVPFPQVTRDGWFREKGTWYRYENGNPCTGWSSYMGVRYYLQPDGSVTTGTHTVDGQKLSFSVTGALITGWLTSDGKMGYRAEDGTAVTGWQTIDGKLYCFDENGVMLTDTKKTNGEITYRIGKDGTAVEIQEAKNG